MKKMRDALVFTLGVLFFIVFLITPVLPSNTEINFIDSARYSAGMFYGASATDLASVMIGFRAMAMDENPYPNLGIAHATLGLDFPLDAKSTHPPTTFLFVAPIAFLPWKYASMSWAFLMLLGIICTFRIFEFTWPQAIGYGFLSILWLPMMMSFGQLTILWLLLMAIAYKARNKNPFISGFFIGIATLLKLLPAVLMMPFLLQKKWEAIYGFLLAVGMGVASVFLISSKAFYEYTNLQQNFQSIMLRSDNSSLFNVAYQHLGQPGLLTSILLLGVFLLLHREQLYLGVQNIQEQSWMFWTFLSVALLPVVWIYSLVPLLPIILNFIESKNMIIKLIGWASIIMPIWGHPWGDKSVPPIAAITLLIGVGITINNSLYKDGAFDDNLAKPINAA